MPVTKLLLSEQRPLYLTAERATRIAVPVLLMNGSGSFPFLHAIAREPVSALPDAKLRIRAGQTDEVIAESLAPVLIDFFKD